MKILKDKTCRYKARRLASRKRVEIRTAGIRKHLKYVALRKVSERRKPLIVKAPKYFLLASDTQREDVLNFIREVDTTLSLGYPVILDFSFTEKLHPCGTLYFLANVDILLSTYPGMIRASRPKDTVVEQLFQHVGLSERLGRKSKVAITAENVVNWHYATGTDASTSAFKSLLMQHGEAMGGLITRSALYDCMSEAVTNTKKHAYPYNEENPLPQWWMFSQANDEILEVVICDLGIGIPKSLLKKPEMRDYFRKLLMVGRPSSHDKELIKVATSTSRSSTGLAYRGKGLPQMLEFIKEGSTGGFRAQSGYGVYSYDAIARKDRAKTFKRPIKGTLIQWTLQLNTH